MFCCIYVDFKGDSHLKNQITNSYISLKNQSAIEITLYFGKFIIHNGILIKSLNGHKALKSEVLRLHSSSLKWARIHLWMKFSVRNLRTAYS